MKSMALIHEKLYQSEDLSLIQFDLYIEDLLQVISRSHLGKNHRVRIKVDADPVPLTITQAIPCGLLLNEIVTNSLKHAFTGDRKGTIAPGMLADVVVLSENLFEIEVDRILEVQVDMTILDGRIVHERTDAARAPVVE
jgi:two-component sensor histidine kinase